MEKNVVIGKDHGYGGKQERGTRSSRENETYEKSCVDFFSNFEPTCRIRISGFKQINYGQLVSRYGYTSLFDSNGLLCSCG